MDVFPFGLGALRRLARYSRKPRPMPLLIQYDEDDDLFTPTGMRNAHQKIAAKYQNSGHLDAYKGWFYPGPHKFDASMQDDALNWLLKVLNPHSG
jgi:hypothetical protein